ncbi:Ribosome biogenesis protein NOC1 [Psilocybe cubensis]|uniref:CCAAT-binding factor domain-containing protein n=2 Tax=Psilocybe cubensis TaxID=181762 RepID=A0A8H8CGB8_PSICU|nr:Ribosome biogenesis protein NOC1 [Psilocybe cubensis]KAH9475490.1 Ribosome biogenesis protein NOC1 [Psilocybe cubensis]
MARIRKEKGRSSKALQSSSKEYAKSSTTSLKNDKTPRTLSKSQISSLGGDEADLELLKGVKQDVEISSGSTVNDAALQNDVSKFLNELNIGSGNSNNTPKSKPNAKGKEKEKLHSGSKTTHEKKGKPVAEPQESTSVSKPSKKDKKHVQKTETPAPSTTTAPVEERPKVVLPTKVTLNPKSQFVFQPISQWYNALPTLDYSSSASTTITPAQLSSLSQKAAELHEKDISTFLTSSSSNSSSSEASFLAKIISSGTLSDRLSALTLLVQSSPLHNIKALETLRTMAERGKGKGGREESLKALRCIVDWWVGGGAPNRKLKYFRDQPLLHPGVTDEYLLLWHFEDWLKKYFFSVLQVLETLSLDPLPYVRTQTISLIFTLLKDKPEQEQNLLRLLVNKLGDTEKSLASRASYHLLQLLQSHPAMKAIVVREIISLVLRPAAPTTAAVVAAAAASTAASANKHIRFGDAEPPKPAPTPKGSSSKDKEKKSTNSHARYYATVTFNQIVLTPGDKEVALQLIDVYFEMFKELLGEGLGEEVDGEADEKVDHGKGKGKGKEEEEFKTDKGGRIMERSKGKGKGKGKVMEIKGAAGFTEVEDSNSKLVSAILTGVNRALPFAKIDAADVGINKHIDTLFLITHKSTFNISLQALVLIQQISASLSSSLPPSSASSSSSSSAAATAKSITDRYYRTLYASLHDTRLATSSKQAMYLNLFFKSIKADAGVGTDDASVKGEKGERVKALIRRFVQVLVSGGGGAPEFIAGGLFLLGELFSSIPGLRAMINEKPKAQKGDDAATQEAYDPRKREPQFAHASALPLWELTPLLNHYHPAVALHARQLLTSQPLTASADLSQNTLLHFLDRFVYKNPKKLGKDKGEEKEGEEVLGAKGASAMQPAASALDGVKLMKGEAGRTAAGMVMVNEAAFLKKRREDVPVDQLFFHDFFTRKNEREKAKAAKVNKRKDDEEESEEDEEEGEEDENVASDDEADADEPASEFSEEDSDADEAEIWKVMQATMPKAAGEDDDLMLDSDVDEDEDASVDFGDDSELNGSDLDIDDDEEVGSENDEDEGEEEDDDDEEGGLSLAEDSDNEDLIPLDGMEHPLGLIEYDGSDADSDAGAVVDEDEVWGGISSENKKRKRGGKEDPSMSREKRKKRKALPTFASYEDYAKMIEEGPEDDI